MNTLVTLHATPPKVTIVCVIDQLAHRSIKKHWPFLTGGIKKLLSQGLVYSNARYPHARPATATGHTALSTGTYANRHGVMSNNWPDPVTGKDVSACDDPDSLIFSPTGFYPKGKSASHIMADGLSEHCKNHAVISMSLKARAAIGMGTKGAESVWFDIRGGQFTTSTAFSKRLPIWVKTFNDLVCSRIQKRHQTTWNLRYPIDHEAYQYALIDDERFAGHKESLLDKPQPIPAPNKEKAFDAFTYTPDANRLLLLLARHALNYSANEKPHKPILLWLSMSSLDFVGHVYGPDSRESVDTLYHIDAQLDAFITSVEKRFGRTNCAWVLTGDHGVMSIPELLRTQGIPGAQRLITNDVIAQLNQSIYRYFNIKNMVLAFDTPDIWFNPEKWRGCPDKTKRAVADHVKHYMLAIPGIKHAWRYDELLDGSAFAHYDRHDRAHWFAKQYYPGRSGQVVCQVHPYTYITEYPTGTSHCTPYDYDVHVPLGISWPSHISDQTVDAWVSMLQVSPTLAQLLEVNAPTHADSGVLPGLA